MPNLNKSTKPISEKNIVRTWHLVDGSGQILGRLSSRVAQLLIGKHKVSYISHLDSGDNVVVINSALIKLTGRKEQNKTYRRYSGFPGGLKDISYTKMKLERPKEIVRHAVLGMLPKNKLRDRMITRLFIYETDKHPHTDKIAVEK